MASWVCLLDDLDVGALDRVGEAAVVDLAEVVVERQLGDRLQLRVLRLQPLGPQHGLGEVVELQPDRSTGGSRRRPTAAAPVPMNSWGMHSSLVESQIARLFGVPSIVVERGVRVASRAPRRRSSWSGPACSRRPSTSRMILRPSMPPLVVDVARSSSSSRRRCSPKPASGPDVGRLMNSWMSVSVMPCFGSQSAGQSLAGSISKPPAPLYTPSIRPYSAPPAGVAAGGRCRRAGGRGGRPRRRRRAGRRRRRRRRGGRAGGRGGSGRGGRRRGRVGRLRVAPTGRRHDGDRGRDGEDAVPRALHVPPKTSVDIGWTGVAPPATGPHPSHRS